MTALAAAALGALLAGGCRRETAVDQAVLAKLESIDQGIGKLNATLAAGKGVAGNGGAAAAPRARPPAPDPAAVFAVPVAGAPVDGKPDALVTIVKGYEYACPYCEKSRPTIDRIRSEYGDDVRVVYEQYVVHPQVATDAALAACAAHRQGRFAAVDGLLWEKAYKARKFDRATIEAIGKEAGLDPAKMKADMDGACATIVPQQQAGLAALGTTGTPQFYINGRYIAGGGVPFEKLKPVIDEELAKAKQRVAQGAKPATYYQDWVLGKGLTSVAKK